MRYRGGVELGRVGSSGAGLGGVRWNRVGSDGISQIGMDRRVESGWVRLNGIGQYEVGWGCADGKDVNQYPNIRIANCI